MIKTDCLIIGGGLSGMMAARETVAAGFRTTLLRDGLGASPWVHGFNHPVRKGDSAAVFLADTLKSGQGQGDPALSKALTADSGKVFEILKKLGLPFNRDADGALQAIRPLGASYPRVISVGNDTGSAVLTAIERELDGKLGIVDHARALRLITSKKRVTGALYYDRSRGKLDYAEAKVVILACGGFSGIFPVTTNKQDSGGDGAAMAYLAGAELCDMEFVQFEPSASVWPPELRGTSMITTLFYEGAVLRNRQGERFMLRYGEEGEKVGKDRLSYCIAEEIKRGNGTAHGGVYMDLTGVDPCTLNLNYPMYVERYKAVGIDLSTTPVELAPAPHTSLGGVKIDARCRTAVQGLLACGEVAGGVHGANRLGGSGGLEAMVFGRRAGKTAVSLLKKQKEQPAFQPLPPENAENVPDHISFDEILGEFRKTMEKTLQFDLGVIRDGGDLQRADETLCALQRMLKGMDCRNDRCIFAKVRLENDLITARAVLKSAYLREESVGCHIRSDDKAAPETRYQIRVKLGAENEMRAERISA